MSINPFDQQYQALVRDVLERGYREINQRTGEGCISLPGRTMQFDLAEGFPVLTLRKIPLTLFIAEQIWFLMGAQKLDFLQQFTHIWDDFADEDNAIVSAYGYRWRHHFQRDQITGLIDLLRADPSSRHGVVAMWDPSDDGLANGTPKPNVPCPFTFTVQIMGGRLCLHLIIRSNDLLLGNPHDVSGFALLVYIFAEVLGVPAGIMTVSISNAHIYKIHEAQAQELVQRPLQHDVIPFMCPTGALARAEVGDASLVREIVAALQQHYNPQPKLARMQIVL